MEWEVQMNYEPERYELLEGPAYRFELDRREFFKIAGAGLAVLLLVEDSPAQESGGGRRRQSPGLPQEIGAWLHITENGKAMVYTGKAEVGQNIRTSLSQVVSDELRVPVESIHIVMADTDLTPYDAGTFGSRTTPDMASRLRRVSAVAREALADLAAESWKVDRSSIRMEGGKAISGTRSAGYGELTRGQKLLKTVAADVKVMPAAEWHVAGHDLKKVNGRAFVIGEHKFASDMRLPDMQYGKVLRAPAFGSTLSNLDARQAEELPGVTVVRDGGFVGVVAPSPRLANDALKGLTAEWAATPQPSGRTLFADLKEHAKAGAPDEKGSIERGMAEAQVKLNQSYTVAYIAHVPLEPRAAVAEWKDGKLTVWTGTQRPFGVKSELAEAFQIPPERVRVIVPDTGSGYGGKHTGEAAIEAARLARAAAKPVKLVWTREEEFTWAYARPAGVIDVSSGTRGDGTVSAWEFYNYNSGGSSIRPVYDFPNQRIAFRSSRSPLRQGSYRALAASANTFAREVHLDEIAHELKIDPLELRLKNLKDERFRAVLEAVAGRMAWPKKASGNRGYGIAAGFEKAGYVATGAQVLVDPATGRVQVERLVCTFDCGAVVNPDHLRNQIEGSLVMGIGGALFEAIDFDQGKILNAKLGSYRVPRFSDSPVIETILMDRKDLPSAGAGEAPIICVAPAIGNAIFHATGIRLRSMPLAPDGLKKLSSGRRTD
jgi:isoquinoline 1-oxidoreductase